ncbi:MULTISPECIES: potassium channel family protein [unclassified Candidatus Frackibacter]|uniref:potassium channel family protein n=1 Tax=unclassified Candidatus Frackibacter TaxID=2648818 RepID=UPI000891BEDA|nr:MULTISPECIES: TrkA family potassium uptake protein [unclassified Candidatus Frackibacter]SDC39937.1 trk system potassium uptake protein TrkA [Candidatus Frackibacter sp. WG11]SEM60773.1 trk system potassium uptake protein TrkA [Candidatus Frackibacter sp. WG12]SFL61160.1 trk system potassium uptake protein TrkA [Candidatus Frackibacter sp. WG13]
MYIIIAGGGIVGRNLTKRLAANHDVVVIDVDREICERIYSQYGAISICGNATQIDVLREAGIEKCDVAVGVMRNDADNLAFSLLAKNYGLERILVRMREPEYESAYKMAGATNIAGAMEMMVDKFVVDIEQPEIQKVISLEDGKAEISIVTIPEKAKCSGLTVSEIVNSKGFPEKCVIAGIFDQEVDELIIPRGNKRINSNNKVFLVATRENIEKAANYLRK